MVVYLQLPLAGGANADECASAEGEGGRSAREHDAEERGTLMRLTLGGGGVQPLELVKDVLEFKVSADLSTVAIRCDEDGEQRLRCFAAGERAPETDDDDQEVDADEPGAASGLVPLSARASLYSDPLRDWRQMFAEAWAATARLCHPSVLEGIDHAAVLRAYGGILSRVCCAPELRDLMHQMQTELGASHASVAPPEEDECDGDDELEGQQGFLGVSNLTWDDGLRGWRIGRLISGASWDAGAPLAATLGARVTEGDCIVAINQHRLSPELPPEIALRGLAGKQISVSIRSGSAAGGSAGGSAGCGSAGGSAAGGSAGAQAGGRAGGGTGGAVPSARSKERQREVSSSRGGDCWRRRAGGGGGPARGGGSRSNGEVCVRVRAVGRESIRRALYLDHVSASRAAVRCLCGSLVAYLHVADMEESGYEDFCRQFLCEASDEREALLLDLRGNSGGSVSDLLLQRLAMPRIGAEAPAHGVCTAIPGQIDLPYPSLPYPSLPYPSLPPRALSPPLLEPPPYPPNSLPLPGLTPLPYTPS